MTLRPKVAVIGTGGTISSIGRGPFDLQNYVTLGKMLDAKDMIAQFGDVQELAELIPVAFPPIPSTRMGFAGWQALLARIDAAVSEHPDLAGIVILHGTASLEETAYALHLTTHDGPTIVLTGAQRPATGLSTDGAMNFAAAVRVAASPDAAGLGVLVVLNDEIQAAREVTKTSTWRLQTFRTPDFGVLGHADADQIAIYRKPARMPASKPAFDIRALETLPRVDISYAYTDADGTAVRAFVAAGAKGLVSAGFAPGMTPPEEFDALVAAAASGVLVVQSTRAGSGRVPTMDRLAAAGIIGADNLNPQKARILLALALTQTTDVAEITEVFATH
ncbi:MAG: asparaginase [Pseudomonadota bacterium]